MCTRNWTWYWIKPQGYWIFKMCSNHNCKVQFFKELSSNSHTPRTFQKHFVSKPRLEILLRKEEMANTDSLKSLTNVQRFSLLKTWNWSFSKNGNQRGSWVSKNFKNPKQGVVNKIKEPPSTDLNQSLVCLWHQALSGY